MDLDGLALLRRHGLFHADDRTIALPPAISRLPRQQLLRFLERLLEANRQVRPGRQNRISFVARSEALVCSVQHLLLRFGVVTSRHVVRDQHRGAERTVYALVVESASAHAVDVDAAARLGVPVRALVAVGRAPSRPGAGDSPAEPPGRASARRVLGRDRGHHAAGDEQVYDLTVPGLANFVAADVVVHNTSFALGIATHVAVEAALPSCSSPWRWATPS
jgi:replicative DNA helicase